MSHGMFDSHTHSDNSIDAQHSVMFMCEKALEQGLSGLCITDHCELRDYEQCQLSQRLEQSFFDVSKAARVFNGRFTVLAGIEMSDLLADPDVSLRIMQAHAYDLVLASQHCMPDGTDISNAAFKTWTSGEIDRYLEWYFDRLVRIATWGQADVLAHLTYPVRYITGRNKIPVDLGRYADQFEQILRQVAQNGKAIEINTSGLWQALGDTLPPFDIIRRFRELGGCYVTVGSDAHSADTVGRGIYSGMQILADAGFSCYTIFKQRQPIQIPLV